MSSLCSFHNLENGIPVIPVTQAIPGVVLDFYFLSHCPSANYVNSAFKIYPNTVVCRCITRG